jgi:hypothetical protein
LTIREVYMDAGVSGATLERPYSPAVDSTTTDLTGRANDPLNQVAAELAVRVMTAGHR